jgi:hypothetical protein
MRQSGCAAATLKSFSRCSTVNFGTSRSSARKKFLLNAI